MSDTNRSKNKSTVSITPGMWISAICMVCEIIAMIILFVLVSRTSVLSLRFLYWGDVIAILIGIILIFMQIFFIFQVVKNAVSADVSRAERFEKWTTILLCFHGAALFICFGLARLADSPQGDFPFSAIMLLPLLPGILISTLAKVSAAGYVEKMKHETEG